MLKDLSTWTIFIDDLDGELCMENIDDRSGRFIQVVSVEEMAPLLQDNAIKIKAVIGYCEPHIEKMWAATIVGHLLGCDFKDAKYHIELFNKFLEEQGL